LGSGDANSGGERGNRPECVIPFACGLAPKECDPVWAVEWRTICDDCVHCVTRGEEGDEVRWRWRSVVAILLLPRGQGSNVDYRQARDQRNP